MISNTNCWPKVLIVGEMSQPELHEITAPLEGTAEWTHFAGIDEAVDSLTAANSQPELIVLAQSRPGKVSHAGVRRLQAAAPLAGMYAVLGSWCEGETRTGEPWPGVARCYWHEWPLQWRVELSRMSRGELPLWTLPATVSLEERLLVRCRPRDTRLCEEFIVVVADSREAEMTLGNACRAAGFTVAATSSKAMAILWDTTTVAARDPRKVAITKSQCIGAPLMALITYPRKRDMQEILAAGVDAALAKPFLLDDLLAEIERLSSTR